MNTVRDTKVSELQSSGWSVNEKDRYITKLVNASGTAVVLVRNDGSTDYFATSWLK